MAAVFTPEQEQRINDIFIEDWGKYGSAIGSDTVHELTPEELTDEHLSTLTIPGMNPVTEKWEQTSMRNMMKPVKDAISHLETEDQQVQNAILSAGQAASAANTAAGNADTKAAEASLVNCTISGMTVTVTNRQGVSNSVNIGFEIAPENVYASKAAMIADAANVLAGKFCMIATTDPTSADNATLWSRNSQPATAGAAAYTFLSDLDQASSSAWADWLDNMKPAIQDALDDAADDHRRADDDHTQAQIDHTTAASDHTTAASDHTRAEVDHSTAGSDHTTAGNDHTRAEGDHTTAGSDHTQAGIDHTTASADHTQASTDHTRAEGDHGIAVDDHTTAGADHTTAGTDHTASTTATAAANTQANRAKAWADHPPYIGDGTTGDLNYWYLWNETTAQYVKGPYAKGDNLDFDSMTPEEYQRLVDDVRDSVLFATVQTCEDIIDELV